MQDILFRMLALGPYSTPDAIRVSVGHAMDDLAALHIKREDIGRSASEVEYNVSTHWCGAGGEPSTGLEVDRVHHSYLGICGGNSDFILYARAIRSCPSQA